MNVGDFSVSDENSEYFRVAWGLSKFLLFEITREKEYFTLSSVGINNQQFMRALARAAPERKPITTIRFVIFCGMNGVSRFHLSFFFVLLFMKLRFARIYTSRYRLDIG